MSRHDVAPAGDEPELEVEAPERTAAGVPAVAYAAKLALQQMGPVRTAQTLRRINQPQGFDCPGCAWPEPGHPHIAEFCENGAKAVAEEATKAALHARLLRPPQRRRAGRAARLLARPARGA